MLDKFAFYLFGLLAWAVLGTTANAAIPLRRSACLAVSDRIPPPSPTALQALPTFCDASVAPPHARWTWFRFDVRQLRAMPAAWRLLAVQSRFDRVVLTVIARDGGVERIDRRADDLDGVWAPGGLLTFPIAHPGRDVAALFLGFEHLDDPSLVRTVTAATQPEARRDAYRWVALIGLFTGALLSAFAYNMMLFDRERRYAFQRWYQAWIATALTYGLTWSNMFAFILPDFVGPAAVRACYPMVGLLGWIGIRFFLSLIEYQRLPARLVMTARTIGAIGLVAGGLAMTDEWLVPAILADHLVNYAMIGTTLIAFVGIGFAIRRKSRIVWFYAAGWGPVILLATLRVLRNLGLFPQTESLDLALFAAMAFEAVVLSLATADRFRSLMRALEQVTEAREHGLIESAALRHAALTDPLTGLGNRAAFQQALHAGIGGHAGLPTPFTLFLIDVDHLKSVNDSMGHAAGDALLVKVATKLADLATDGVFIARLGGDEFAVIAAGEGDWPMRIERRIAAIQGQEWQHAGNRRSISISVGSVCFPTDAVSDDLLYRNADLALYQAKRHGRAGYRRYEPVLRSELEVRSGYVADATSAIARRQFLLRLHPIRHLGTGSLIAFETQLCWNHPEHGLLLSEQFADLFLADRIGGHVENHMLDLALQMLRDDPDGLPALHLPFVATRLAGAEAADHILDRLTDFGVPPAALCIQISESMLGPDLRIRIATTLHRLHIAGVRIAFTDLGMGDGTLRNLTDLPVDILKIDHGFVAALTDARHPATIIVRAITAMARRLQKDVIAEGIESAEQQTRLIALGCRLGQGPWFDGDRVEDDPILSAECG